MNDGALVYENEKKTNQRKEVKWMLEDELERNLILWNYFLFFFNGFFSII